MNIRKNITATKIYTAIENAEIIADFALDLLASAHRIGMDTVSAAYESIRLSAVRRITELTDLLELVCSDAKAKAYLDRYNAILDGKAA